MVDGTTGDETYKSGPTERICNMIEMSCMVGACDGRAIARTIRVTDLPGKRDFSDRHLGRPWIHQPESQILHRFDDGSIDTILTL